MIRHCFNWIAIGCGLAVVLLASPVWADRGTDDYRVAAYHYGRGEWQPAHEALTTFLKDHPGHQLTPSVHFYRGEVLIQLDRHDEAVRSFSEFLSLAPDHPQATHAEFRIAECYFLSGKDEAAQRAFHLFQEKHPESPIGLHIHPYLAEISVNAADWDAALEHFRRAEEAASGDAEREAAQLGQARIYTRQEKWTEARTAYRDLASQASDSTLAIVALEQGILEFKTDNYRAAVAHWDNVPSTAQGPRREADLWTAKVHFKTRDWAAAERYLRQVRTAKELTAEQEEIEYLLARAVAEQGRLDKAEEVFQGHVQRFPQSRHASAVRYHLLAIQIDRNDEDAVRQAIAKLQESPPLESSTQQEDPAGDYVRRGRVAAAKFFQSREQHETALSLLEATDPAAGPLDRQIWYLRGISELALDRHDQALATFNQLIGEEAQDAYNAGSRLLVGKIHLDGRRWSAASSSLAEMADLKLSPEMANQRACWMTIALAEQGQLHEARELYRELNRDRIEPELYLDTTRRLGEIAFREQSIPWATELFQRLAGDANPPEIVEQGLAGLAWCQVAAANAQDSETTIAELTRRYPASRLIPAVLLMQAKAYESVDPPKAIAIYRQILDDETSLEEKHLATAGTRLAAILEQRGAKGQAAAVYDRLLADLPTGLSQDDILYRLAWCHFDLEAWDEAAATFRRLNEEHRKSPFWADATYRLAELAAKDNDSAAAIRYLDAILELDQPAPIQNYARYMRGHIAIGGEDWPVVAEQMDQITETSTDEPLRSLAAYWAGEAQFKMGQFDAARSRLESLVRDNLGRDLPTNQVAQLRLAQIAAQQEDWDLTQTLAQRLREQHPDFDQQYEVDYLIGRCLARQAKFSAAREAYERVVRSDSGRRTETAAMAQWMIGETYLHQQDYPAAIRAYAKVGALFDYPRWKAAALLQMGKCHEAQNQWAEAANHYREITEDYAETMYAAEAGSRLEAVGQQDSKAADRGQPDSRLR